MTSLDFIGVYDAVTRLKTMGFMPDLEWDVCALHPEVTDGSGLQIKATRCSESLSGYDMVILPGGYSTRELVKNNAFIAWLQTTAPAALKISVCTGSLLWGAAGFLKGKRATTHPNAFDELKNYTDRILPDRIVDEGDLITAGGVTSSIDLGLYLCEKLAGPETAEKIRRQMDYQGGQPYGGSRPLPASDRAEPVNGSIPHKRTAKISRKTKETSIDLAINLDGRGAAEIDTGLGFLDHMLAHLAVHGLLDLQIKASGDLQVDAHHTVEDIALALGKAFDQALGDRAGIVRMASATTPMDEALAFVAVDFSGRPYAVIQADWHTPAIGVIPTSLFDHFLQSFASAARCNLHARLLSGKDDHHQAEALFKALGRALDQAKQIDPRRAGAIPSTKGTLIV
jgi:imidazoleglycerol-phosphate dehydratase